MTASSQRWLIHRNQEQGYVLLTLLLIFALLAIAAAVVVPSLQFEIRRDREEELLHRGVQYRRAVRLYSKGMGHLPNRPEELLGTQGQRFIRRLYKDPITGKDFKLLHIGDIQGPPPSLGTPVGQISRDASSSNGAQDPSAVSQQNNPPAASEQNNPTPASSNPPPAGANPATSSNPMTEFHPLILGVASTSKDRTIREFNRKNHYNDWWFYYDPRNDLVRESNTPTAPLQMQAAPVNPPAAPESGQDPQQTPVQSPQ